MRCSASTSCPVFRNLDKRHIVSCLSFLLLITSATGQAQQDEYSFEIEEYVPKPFKLIGYVEAKPEYARANQEGALYQLQFYGLPPQDYIERFTGTLELDGRFHKDMFSAKFLTHSEVVWDYLGEEIDHELFEGYFSLQPNPGLTLDAGKKTMRWGKGYAWNPVAFVERAKDAGDPDLSREGYWIVAADWIRSFSGALQTLAFTPLILPVRDDINSEFGKPGNNNLAGKLYLLYKDTDIDFMFLSDGSRSPRVGMDFSRNIAPNFEIHGELAFIKDVTHLTLTPECRVGTPRVEDEISYLLGTRYRTDNNVTLIWEYYYSGLGNRVEDQQQFYRCVHRAWEEQDDNLIAQLPVGKDIDKGPFSKPNPMRKYMNFRVWWTEPRNLLYLTPGLQVLFNLDDDSFSVSPDLSYIGFEKWNIRLRATVPFGDPLTEWGEKPNDYKLELRVRYYF